MSAATGWKTVFENWPETVPRQGLLVTNFAETIPFRGFLISPDILLVERELPDSFGARKVMIAYDAISAVKLTTPMELARFQVLGFQPPM